MLRQASCYMLMNKPWTLPWKNSQIKQGDKISSYLRGQKPKFSHCYSKCKGNSSRQTSRSQGSQRSTSSSTRFLHIWSRTLSFCEQYPLGIFGTQEWHPLTAFRASAIWEENYRYHPSGQDWFISTIRVQEIPTSFYCSYQHLVQNHVTVWLQFFIFPNKSLLKESLGIIESLFD